MVERKIVSYSELELIVDNVMNSAFKLGKVTYAAGINEAGMDEVLDKLKKSTIKSLKECFEYT